MPPSDPGLVAFAMATVHLRRLRAVWRSAGWPCQDLIEVELLAAGLLERVRGPQGHETLRVTDAGVQALAASLGRNRARRDAHEALVARVAAEMQRAGRLVWRGLSLRAPVPCPPQAASMPQRPQGWWPVDGVRSAVQGVAEPAAQALAASLPQGPAEESANDSEQGPAPRPAQQPTPGPVQWCMAMPDVYSIRHTTVETAVEPIVHEIKVSRADLLSDLRQPRKGEAYRALSSQCWYVLKHGIATPDEVPEPYGVMLAQADGTLDVVRPAPRRPMRLPLAVWMALARAHAEPSPDDPAQPGLAPCDGGELGPGWGA